VGVTEQEMETQTEEPTPAYEWWRLLVEVEDTSIRLGGAHRKPHRPS
jgi:hypothetical protein